MLQKMIIPAAILIASISGGCGAGKKLDAANARADQMAQENSQLNTKINSLQGEVTQLSNNNKAMTDELNKLKSTCEADRAKLKATMDILQSEADNMKELERRLDVALAEFKGRGVNVEYKDGLLHVVMEDNLLYKSGSSKLGTDGRKALGDLAEVLNDFPKLRVIVLGNTDDVPFVRTDKDNWTLSTERANGVIRILRDDFSVEPSRLTAAGKGKFNPVAENSTAEGRQKNRRTDIILNPDIEKVYQSIRANEKE